MRILKKTDSVRNRLTGLLPTADEAGVAFTGAMVREHDAMEKMAQFEAARLGAKYGVDSKRAKEARSLADELTLEAQYWALEQARANRKIPKLDPDHWVVFGMVLDPQGQPVSGATLTAVNDQQGGAVHTATNRDGEYELRIPAAGSVQIRVSSRDGKTETAGGETFEGKGGKLAYREYVLAPGASNTSARRKGRR